MSTHEQSPDTAVIPLPAVNSITPNSTHNDIAEVSIALPSVIVNPLTDATFDDVVLTPVAETVVAGNRKSQLTRLKEIKGSSLTTLNTNYLRSFCHRNGLKGHRKTSKIDICNAIVEAKASGVWKDWTTTHLSTSTSITGQSRAKTNVVINR